MAQPDSIPSPVLGEGGQAGSNGTGTGIKVVMKPEYQVAGPAKLQPPARDVSQSLFQPDFDFERRMVADFELGAGQDGSAIASAVAEDPVVARYVEMGLDREAVAMALATFGDVQDKVLGFCPSYLLLREMGFPSAAVAGALRLYDNDRDKAIAHFVLHIF